MVFFWFWQAPPGPPITPPVPPVPPDYNFFLTLVTGNFGLTVVLLIICFRCLRWVERDLDEYRRRKDRET